MDVEQLDEIAYCEATKATHANMARHARDAGWEPLSQRLLPRTVEQEGISIRLPISDAAPPS